MHVMQESQDVDMALGGKYKWTCSCKLLPHVRSLHNRHNRLASHVFHKQSSKADLIGGLVRDLFDSECLQDWLNSNTHKVVGQSVHRLVPPAVALSNKHL